MKKANLTSVLSIIIVVLFLPSCVPVNKMEYLHDKTNQDLYEYKVKELKPNLIESNDLLSIQVSSFDQTSSNFLQESANSMAYASEQGMVLVSYTVDIEGNVHIPIIGAVHLEGLTLNEATSKLQLSLQGYLNEPVVSVKFVNKRVVIMGEVQAPGSYTYTKEYINVFDALSFAGDITDFGNRKSVFLIRAEREKIIKKRLNLRDPQFLTSEDYYLKEGDILYVKPLGAKRTNLIYQPLTLFLSSISSLILLVTFIQNNGQ